MNFSLGRAAVPFAFFALVLIPSGCNQLGAPAAPAAPSQEESAASVPTESASTEEAIQTEKINLNDMTREQLLDTIPDMGSRMVREFFEYQPYVSIQQFRREIGKYVDDEQVAFYENYVYVPVDVNESDRETLMQIPGLDDEMADALIAARPFPSNDAFLTALADHLNAEQLEAAPSYLNE